VSARREKRLRNLMSRIEYLERLARVNEVRLHDLEKLAAAPTFIQRQPDQATVQPQQKRGLLQRVRGIFSGK